MEIVIPVSIDGFVMIGMVNGMPQSERSQIIKEMLMWIVAKTKKDGGASLSLIVRHCESEITNLGATQRTVQSYLSTLVRHRFVTLKGLKYVSTQTGENWLEKKVS